MRSAGLLGVAISFALILCCAGRPRAVLAAQGACGAPDRQNVLKRKLLASATGVVGAVERGDIERFMESVSRRGLGFGVDVPLVARADLARQMRSRSGYYCLLFSSECMGTARRLWQADPVLSKFKASYRDGFNQGKPYKIEAELLTESDLCGGLVRFSTEGTGLVPAVLELEFTLEGGRWVLINTPYELGE